MLSDPHKYFYRKGEVRAEEADDEEEMYRNSRMKHVKSPKHLDAEEYEEELLHHRTWNRYNSLPNVTTLRTSHQEFSHRLHRENQNLHGNTSSTKSPAAPLHVKQGSDGVGIYQHVKG